MLEKHHQCLDRPTYMLPSDQTHSVLFQRHKIIFAYDIAALHIVKGKICACLMLAVS